MVSGGAWIPQGNWQFMGPTLMESSLSSKLSGKHVTDVMSFIDGSAGTDAI